MHTHQLVVTMSVAILATATAQAQENRGTLSLSAGTATDISGVRTNAITFAPAMSTGTPGSAFSIGASGTVFGNHAWSTSLATAYSAHASSIISPTIDLAANGVLTSYAIFYLTADATPGLALNVGAVKAFGGVHLSGASTSRASASPAPSPFALPGPAARISRSGTTVVSGLSLSGMAETGSSYALGARDERGAVAGASQTDDQLTAAMGSTRLLVSGTVGRRSDVAGLSTYGSVGATIGASDATSIIIAAGRYPANAMTGTPAGQFATAGLSITLGGVHSPALPSPAGADHIAPGMTRLSIRADDATTVDVAGDFNHWERAPARRASNGVWYADLRIPPGTYRYAFRIDDKEWRVPAGVAAADDEFGGKSAWLTVTRTAGMPEK